MRHEDALGCKERRTGNQRVEQFEYENEVVRSISKLEEILVKAKKSWQQKLADDKGLPKVVKITGKMSRRWGSGTMAVPAPREVDAIMRRVPKGRLITINEIRAELARKHRATIGCPITTGIFAWIAAWAADEALKAGKKKVTPYWRTLKTGGELNEKYPGGIKHIAALLRSEGHRIVKRGSRSFVADYEIKLFKA